MTKKIGKSIQTSSVATDQGSVTAVLGGESTAVGQDTLAEGSASLHVKDHGPVTIVRGTAAFCATAQSTDDSPTYATADSFAYVSGADLCRTKTKTTSQADQDEDTSTWSATSTTRL